ncbi:MAG: TonB-dependent receptor [Cyclobacteriaceae bacterium]|nr:TonB-dependent receptor [Cyclobacteriaceae bacterium]
MRTILLLIFFLLFSYTTHAQDMDKQVRVDSTHEYALPELFDYLISFENVPLVFSKGQFANTRFQPLRSLYSVRGLLDELRAINVQYEIMYGSVLLRNTRKNQKAEATLTGFVRDAESGEALIGATIQRKDSIAGTSSNSYGFYSLSFPIGTYVFVASYVGYQPVEFTVDLQSNIGKNLLLAPETTELEEVMVVSRQKDHNVSSKIPGTHTMEYEEKGQIPYFLGEVDILQESLLLPGIRTLGEDASGLNVRGGDIDQNLILLDDAVIYNPNHFYGLISVFNPEAVNQVHVLKGYIPPVYGGRASSVINIHQREGNDQDYHLSGGIGLVSARAVVEGPIVKDKSSFIVSARQSLFDLSLNNKLFSGITDSRTSFHDLNMKVNWKANQKNTFYISGYSGDDRNTTAFDAIRRWGNRTFTTRWNHTWNPKFFSHVSYVISDYNHKIVDPVEAGSFIGRSNITDHALKIEQQYHDSPSSLLEFGGKMTYHRLTPGDLIPFDTLTSSTNPLYLDEEHGLEYGIYLSHEQDFTPRLGMHYGMRYSGLISFGPGNIYLYEEGKPKSLSTITDTLSFGVKEVIDRFSGLEPRFSLTYKTSPSSSIKTSFTRTFQYISLISNTATPSPTDIWKISNRYLPPLSTSHLSLGYYLNFRDNNWEASIESYYKNINHLIDYKNGADLWFNPNPETELIQGTGRAYGLEFFLQRNVGKWKGWMSYSLSRSERQFDGPSEEETINFGRYFPDDQDKTHDLSLVGMYVPHTRLHLSATFNYSTGRPITFPSGKYWFQNTLVPDFTGNRNHYRISDYHRLDMAAKWQPRSKKPAKSLNFQQYWTLSIYNVYARKNAYSYFFRQSLNDPTQTEVAQYSIFGTIIPSVTYNFRF